MTRPRQFDLIAFDWDGTLFDSTALIARCIQAACADLGVAVPSDKDASYVIGMGLILIFATGLFHWFPAVSLLAPGEKAWEDPQVVVLPAATLILAVVPYISRIMRGSMIEVLESEYVTMARLKGPEAAGDCLPLFRRTVVGNGPLSGEAVRR